MQSVILDLGTRSTKAGFSGASFPVLNFPSLVSRARVTYEGKRAVHVGHDATHHRGIYYDYPRSPVEVIIIQYFTIFLHVI